MAVISRGFGARRRESTPELPPGQYLTEDFPVLSAGPTPNIHMSEWSFGIRNEVGEVASWTWDQLHELPIEDVHTDVHCVTRWSKLGTSWRGVSLDTLFEEIDTAASFAMAHSYGGYTTNIPLDDLLGGQSWIAFEFEGEPLAPEHGGPARLIVPHLYFWKSAKWLRALTLMEEDAPGFWEQNGYNMHGDPWTEERYW